MWRRISFSSVNDLKDDESEEPEEDDGSKGKDDGVPLQEKGFKKVRNGTVVTDIGEVLDIKGDRAHEVPAGEKVTEKDDAPKEEQEQ